MSPRPPPRVIGVGALPIPPAPAPDGTECRPRPGRPRSEECDRAIEAAALELLAEDGFGRMSMEGIAARAGVGKATIYRRWDTKEELLVDAVTRGCLDHLVTPDTGSLRADLLELFGAVLARFQRDGPVMLAFAAEQGRHPELAETFRRTFLAERRRVTRQIITRGVERGELAPGADIELLADVAPALFWHRLAVWGGPLDAELPERIVDQFFPTAGPPGGVGPSGG